MEKRKIAEISMDASGKQLIVKKGGNGARIQFLKRFIGYEVMVTVYEKIKQKIL